MVDQSGNVFANLPNSSTEEVFEKLHQQAGVSIERIISNGQTTPEGDWYDQATDEWVLVLKGKGALLFENGTECVLDVGDYIFIPKHKKHRVIHTAPHTLWLAIHMD